MRQVRFEAGAIYDQQQLAKGTSRSTSAIEKDRIRGRGPKFFRAGRLVRYRGEEILMWMERGGDA